MTTEDGARIYGDRYVLGDRLTAEPDREVWRAHDDIVSRAVVLTIFFGTTAADPTWRATFRYAADRLVALSHPGIAKVYEHGESADEAWLAVAYVSGETLAVQLARGIRPSAAEAFELIGQTAFALDAAHSAAVVHGNLSASSIIVRTAGSVSLIGFSVTGAPTREADFDALEALSTSLLAGHDFSASPRPSDVTDFQASLASTGSRDAKQIGRSALALAAAFGDAAPSPDAAERVRAAAGEPDPAEASFGPAWNEAEKRQVRNRLIVLGTIVVVGGAALLRFVGEGAGDVTVPLVTNLQINQAELTLTNDGLRSNAQCQLGKDSGGVVVSQSPSSGHQVKAGSSVTLVVDKDSCS